MCVAEDLLERKKALGRRASYSIIADRVGKSSTVVWQALNEQPSAIEFDRQAILRDVDRALSEIEAESNPVPVAA